MKVKAEFVVDNCEKHFRTSKIIDKQEKIDHEEFREFVRNILLKECRSTCHLHFHCKRRNPILKDNVYYAKCVLCKEDGKGPVKFKLMLINVKEDVSKVFIKSTHPIVSFHKKV